MSDEEVPLQSNDAQHNQQSTIPSNEVDNGDVDIDTAVQNVNDNNDEIQVTNNTKALNKTDTAETQNLINDSIDNDTKNNDINTDNDPNQSNQSNNEYIVVHMEAETKQNNDNNKIDQHNIKNKDHNELSSDNKMQLQERLSPVSSVSTVSHNFSIDSIGSEPLVSNANKTIKARIVTTWVPQSTLASELTVIAGDTVTIIHSEAIQLVDNPLAVSIIDKIIILNTIHWTQIQQRSGKIGVVPSNILSYTQNPINDVWTKVKIQHSYMAKASDQLTISANERIKIYGCVNEDGMITAQSKNGSQGLIPYNFVEIPTAQNINDALRGNKNNGQSPHFRTSAGSISSGNSTEYDTTHRNSVSRSRHSSIDRVHHPQTSSLKFVIDDTITNIDNDNTILNAHSLNAVSKKNKLTSKIKAISSSISDAIDKIQYASYSHGANKTLEPIPTASNLTSPSGKTKSYDSTSDQIINEDHHTNAVKYEWNAPLQWKKVYILRDFEGTSAEIELVYQAFILDKQSRGRNESILSYSAPSVEQKHIVGVGEEYFDPFNVAAPSKAKKREKDVLKFKTTDRIEITGSPSPEGWILARFCNNKQRKGFVAMSYLQEIETQTQSNVRSGIGALLQQQNLNTKQTKLTEMDEHNFNDEIVPVPALQNGPIGVKDNMDNINNNNIVDEQLDVSVHSKQPLPFHWPFSTYPVKKRSKKSKIIESIILLILFIIYVLPVLIEEPKPENAPKKYNIWWINLFLICFPWGGIFLLRMLELWGKIFSAEENPNNKLYATLLFYIILIVYFFGLFAIVIEVWIQYEWIEDNSPVLLLATIVEILVFITCVSIIILAILFILIWTFCCRIVRNRYETRIEFYCCTKGQSMRTYRYPRTQK